jgi:hypothetical protein
MGNGTAYYHKCHGQLECFTRRGPGPVRTMASLNNITTTVMILVQEYYLIYLGVIHASHIDIRL